ncbi:unnamed protein product [Phytomonas sp. EM1]|nr:unnamed protein product [Phytomonas sp. EM1]|eukprot:CCW60314.1 unnamed protein product [Phytomonas sp. isolate EM1]
MKVLDSHTVLGLLPNDMRDLSKQCEDHMMNAQLFYTSTDQLSCSILTSSNRFVSYGRWLSALSVTSAAVCGLTYYYQYAHLYRVWRIRNPRAVFRYHVASWISGGVFVSTILFMASPLGPMQSRWMQLEQSKTLDALAVKALEFQQAFATLRAWYLYRASCAHELLPFEEANKVTSAQLKGSLSNNDFVWMRVVIPELTSTLTRREGQAKKSCERANAGIMRRAPTNAGDDSECTESGRTGTFDVGCNSQVSLLSTEGLPQELPLLPSLRQNVVKEPDTSSMTSFSHPFVINDNENRDGISGPSHCLENTSKAGGNIGAASTYCVKNHDARRHFDAKRVYDGTESDEELMKAFLVCCQAWEDLLNARRYLYPESV